MSKWTKTDDRTRLTRAVIVGQFHPTASALDYIRARSRADDGREVC